jgi:GNAT superfamily N-acetyltransferase
MTGPVRIAEEPFDAPDAQALRAAHEAEMRRRYGDELRRRYGGATAPGDRPTAADMAAFLLARDAAGDAVGCAGLRDLGEGTMEIKRMFVCPGARGRGIGRQLLAAIEARARALGAHALRLETGTEQPEARGLYESAGYTPIAPYGAYRDSPRSRCYAREI